MTDTDKKIENLTEEMLELIDSNPDSDPLVRSRLAEVEAECNYLVAVEALRSAMHDPRIRSLYEE